MNCTKLLWMALYGATIVAACRPSPTWAQAPALGYVAGEWVPNSNVETADDIDDLGPTPDVEAQISTFSAGFNVPIRVSDGVSILTGASYDLLAVDQTRSLVGVVSRQELHAVTASVLANIRLTPTWQLTVSGAPALVGDFVDVDGSHFRISGAVLASHSFSDRFSLGAGAILTWQLGRPLPLPALSLRWRATETLRFEAFLPLRGAAIWRPFDRLELGVSASIRGQAYALTTQRVQGRWPCRAQVEDNPATAVDEREAIADRCFDTLAYSRGEISPTVSVRITSSLWLSVRVGFLFFRRYEFLNDDNETPDIGDLRLDPNVVVQSRLELRIPGT